MSIAQFNSLYAAAVAAIDAGDYAAAITAATKAQLLLGTTPNLTRSLGQGDQEITWNDGAAIARFIDDTRKLQRADNVGTSGPFGQSAVTYARPTG